MRSTTALVGVAAAVFSLFGAVTVVVAVQRPVHRVPATANEIAAQGNAAVKAIRRDAREAVREQNRLELPMVLVD